MSCYAMLRYAVRPCAVVCYAMLYSTESFVLFDKYFSYYNIYAEYLQLVVIFVIQRAV